MKTINLAETAVDKCERIGATEAEAFVQRHKVIEVVLERGEIQSERSKTRHGIGIRLIKDKKLGFTYSSILDEPNIERICRSALKLAESSPMDPYWVSLAYPKKIPSAPAGIYDRNVANLKPEDILGLVVQAYDAAKSVDPRVSIDDGKLSAYTGEVAVVNSHGISLMEKATSLSFSLACMARENGTASSLAYEYEVSRILEGFSAEKVGELAARKAVSSLNPKSVQTFEGEILFSTDVASEVLFAPVISSVNADNAQRRRSAWADKTGEEVSDPNLTVTDDGLLPLGISSSAFDAEGIPCQRTILIDRGVLRGFLYDSYTANKAGVESTGNAGRSDYAGFPSVSISNLLVEPGMKKLEELTRLIDRGIVVSRFSGNVNAQSGDFSGLVKQAHYVEKGEVKFPLKETMIAGNVFKTLHDIIEIGVETRPSMLGVYTPPILAKNLKVVSK